MVEYLLSSSAGEPQGATSKEENGFFLQVAVGIVTLERFPEHSSSKGLSKKAQIAAKLSQNNYGIPAERYKSYSHMEAAQT